MALARTDLLQQITGTVGNFGAGNFTSSSFTPPSNSLLVVAVGYVENNGTTTDPASSITISGGGWTWAAGPSISSSPTSFPTAAKIFTAPVSTGASMTLTVGSGGRSSGFYAVSVVAYTGYDTSTPTGTTGSGQQNGGFAGPPTPVSITLAGTPASTSEVFAGVAMDKSVIGVTPGSSPTVWTEVHDTMHNTDWGGLETEIRSGSTSTSVSWDDLRSGGGALFNFAAVAIEVRQAAAAAAAEPAPFQWLAPGGIAPGSRFQSFPAITDAPAPPAGQSAWWKADSLALSNGAAVASWTDSSGNGQTLAQATGTAQPTYVTNVVNGWPVVRFDGTTDFLDATITSRAQPNTWFAVFKPSSTAALANVTSGGEEIIVDAGGLVEIWGGASSVSNITASTSTWTLLGVQINGASSAIWSDNVAGTIGSLGTDPTNTAFRVGNHTSLSRFFSGDIAEVILYNRTLTTAERTQTFDYLHAKYFVASSSTSPAAEAPAGAGSAPDASVALGGNAEAPQAAGAAPDATGAVGGNAGTPVAAGGALDASVAVGANAEAPAAVGVAPDAVGQTAVVGNAEAPTGVGSAPDASVAIAVNAEAPAGVGLAGDGTAALGVNAEAPVAAGSAPDATVSTAAVTNASAECPTAAGSAPDASVALGVNTDAPSGVGVAGDVLVSVSPNAQAPVGAGSAPDASVAVAVNAECPTATGSAPDATVSTATNVSANAEAPSAAGSAPDASVAVGANAEAPSGAGSALDASSAVAVNAEAPTGSGTAPDASAAVGGNAVTALATGTAPDATAALAVNAEAPTAAGSALDATVSTVPTTNAPAECPTAAGSAPDASVAITFTSGFAVAPGVAGDSAAGVASTPAAVTAAGAAFDAASVAVVVFAQAAAAVGAAFDAVVTYDATPIVVGNPVVDALAGTAAVTGDVVKAAASGAVVPALVGADPGFGKVTGDAIRSVVK